MQKKNIYHITTGYLAENCWIYPLDDKRDTGQTPKSCAVIDPGANSDRIIALLDKLELFPAYILLTHGHFDHIGAVQDLAAEFGSRNIQDKITREKPDKPVIAIHAADADMLKFNTDRLLAEGDTIGSSLSVLHLPGHTKGSIGLWDNEAGILFSGDTLFAGDYGRTDLPGGSQEQIIASLKRLFAMDGNIQVYPGHGPVTTIGIEANRGLIN